MQHHVLDADRDIITIPDVLTARECVDLIAMTEAVGFASAPIATAQGAVMMPEVRDNSRVMLDDEDRAHDLWLRLAPFGGRITTRHPRQVEPPTGRCGESGSAAAWRQDHHPPQNPGGGVWVGL